MTTAVRTTTLVGGPAAQEQSGSLLSISVVEHIDELNCRRLARITEYGCFLDVAIAAVPNIQRCGWEQ